MAKSIFERLAELALARGIREVVKRIKKEGKKEDKKKPSVPKPKPSSSEPVEEKVHPWRTCPIGQHWRRTHPMHADILLDPDIVKALIASESAFKVNPKEMPAGKAGMTHGLFQLTDQAIKALANPKGELTDHLVMIDKKDTLDPNIIVCAGIRWLFQKRKLTSNDLERSATWEETIANYKGYLDDMRSGKDPNPKGMENFTKRLKELKE